MCKDPAGPRTCWDDSGGVRAINKCRRQASGLTTPSLGPRRRALLLAALAAVRVNSRAQELVMLHAWLDAWSGLGAIVVGMQHGRWHCRAPGAGSIVGLSVSGSLMKEGARDGWQRFRRATPSASMQTSTSA